VQFYLSGFHKQSNPFASGAKIFFHSETRALCDGGDDSADAITVRDESETEEGDAAVHDSESAPSAPQ
jgi:hypothetical protein